MIAQLLFLAVVAKGFQIISPIQDQSISFGRVFQVTVDIGEDKVSDFSIAFGNSVICSVEGKLVGVGGSYSCSTIPIDYGTHEIMAQGMIGDRIIQSKLSVVVVPVDEEENVDSSIFSIVRLE